MGSARSSPRPRVSGCRPRAFDLVTSTLLSRTPRIIRSRMGASTDSLLRRVHSGASEVCCRRRLLYIMARHSGRRASRSSSAHQSIERAARLPPSLDVPAAPPFPGYGCTEDAILYHRRRIPAAERCNVSVAQALARGAEVPYRERCLKGNRRGTRGSARRGHDQAGLPGPSVRPLASKWCPSSLSLPFRSAS